MTVKRSDEDLGDARPETEILADTAAGDTLADRSEHEAGQPERAGRAPRKAASLTPQIRDRLALQLRSMYDSVATQPVPDRFADLIARLDSNDRGQG